MNKNLIMPGTESDREDIVSLHSQENGTLTKAELQLEAGRVLQSILKMYS